MIPQQGFPMANSLAISESAYNLRQFAIGTPVAGELNGRSGNIFGMNALSQIATNCKEEVCVRLLESG